MDEFLGPGVSVAYDEKGQPTKAAIGFARGKGLDVANLTRKQTPKGEVVCALIENKGRSTSSLLNEYLPQLIHEIPFQKKMRWANNSLPFARPLHWVAALFDGKALEFEFDGIANNIVSRGHRFLKPEQFRINGIESYLKECEKHFLMYNHMQGEQVLCPTILSLPVHTYQTIGTDVSYWKLQNCNGKTVFPFQGEHHRITVLHSTLNHIRFPHFVSTWQYVPIHRSTLR